jgi:hypothetical protein
MNDEECIPEAYTHEIGPKETLKMQLTKKMKKTPAIERLSLRPPVAPVTWDPITASQIRASVMPIVPKRSGFLLPTRSRNSVMKIKLQTGPTTLYMPTTSKFLSPTIPRLSYKIVE